MRSMDPQRRSFAMPALLLLAVTAIAGQEPQENCLRTSLSTPPRNPTDPYLQPRPAVVEDCLCFSDPRNRSGRFIVSVLVRDERCRPLVSVDVDVDQADSKGRERADCGGRFVTDKNGRFEFKTVRPGHYIDATYPSRPRPRVLQFRVHSDTCNNELLTQFYMKKDKRRTDDPCPVNVCHSNDEGLFMSSWKLMDASGQRVRYNNVTITVNSTCSETRPASTEAPASETQMREVPTTAKPTTAEVTTSAPTPCPNPQPSPWDAIGPFYKSNQPARSVMCREDPQWRQTLKVELTVHLRDQNCRNLAGFPIDLWHTDSYGFYRDYCRSLMTTNSSGMFTVNTIKPLAYPGRPRHIHYIVHSDRAAGRCYDRFNTQSYWPWPDRYDNEFLVKECTDVKDNSDRKTGERCKFTITLRNPGHCTQH